MSDVILAPLPAVGPSATDQVFQALYEAVVTLALPPGAKVSEAEVSKQLDVSRQPVRDAFFRLSKIGLISIRPQRATLVTHISEEAVLDAVFMRLALELEMLRKVSKKALSDDYARLKDILDRQEAALDSTDGLEFHALDEEMHKAMFEIAGHPKAWSVILEQKAHMDRIRRLTLDEQRRRRVLGEHRGIVSALEAGDMAQSESAMRLHLEDIIGVLAGLRKSHGEYFDARRPVPAH